MRAACIPAHVFLLSEDRAVFQSAVLDAAPALGSSSVHQVLHFGSHFACTAPVLVFTVSCFLFAVTSVVRPGVPPPSVRTLASISCALSDRPWMVDSLLAVRSTALDSESPAGSKFQSVLCFCHCELPGHRVD
jgi:hypothetical protein